MKPFGRALAAPLPLQAAHLEDIGEIRAKTHARASPLAAQIEITDLQQLVIRGPPDELAAIDIDQLAMQLAPVRGNRMALARSPAHRAVLGRVRAQQQRAIAVEPQFELRQEPRILVIKPGGAAGLPTMSPNGSARQRFRRASRCALATRETLRLPRCETANYRRCLGSPRPLWLCRSPRGSSARARRTPPDKTC